jgi:hypothetical protein
MTRGTTVCVTTPRLQVAVTGKVGAIVRFRQL